MRAKSKKIIFLILLCNALLVSSATSELDKKIGQVAPPPKSIQTDIFYKKYVDANGLPVLSSEKVSDQALLEAAKLINQMLADRSDIRKALIDKDVGIGVMAPTEVSTDIPEHSHLRPKEYWARRARGLGGRVTTCGEENLLGLPGDPYFNENILIHEFSHCIHEQRGKDIEKNFDSKLQQLYEKAVTKGLWKDTYAGSNHSEYWAEGVQSFFDANKIILPEERQVNTREELIAYDPELANLVSEVFHKTSWLYRKPENRKQGYKGGG